MDIIINEKNYKYIKLLSQGSYGITLLYRRDDNYYVIKYFYPYKNDDYYINFDKEVNINIELINKLGKNNTCNKNYICYIDSFYISIKDEPLYNNIFNIMLLITKNIDIKNIYACITKYIDGETIYNYIIYNEVIYKDIIDFIKFMINVIKELDENNIVHRDIKPDNIIRKFDGNYVLIDFGIACIDTCSDNSINIKYMAPWLKNKNLTFEEYKINDIYSFCITLYILMNKIFPLNKNNEYIKSSTKWDDLNKFIDNIFENDFFNIYYIEKKLNEIKLNEEYYINDIF